MTLSDFFGVDERPAQTHTWALMAHDASSPMEVLAQHLADRIMAHRWRGCPHYYQAWRTRVDGGPPPAGTCSVALRENVKAVFGLPDCPDAVEDDHMEGYVAQVLWYFLILDIPTAEDLVRVEPPGYAATDPGGDGLVIHRAPAGYLLFRLWEVKKCAVQSGVSSTISVAYDQLETKAIQYLARYTAVASELEDAELAEFYTHLIDLWVDAAPQAAAGVSVATSHDHVPGDCFTSFGRRFPRFVDPVRLRGMLMAVSDFPAFVRLVREAIWRGL